MDFFSRCDQITFTEGILNGKLRFLCGVSLKDGSFLKNLLNKVLNSFLKKFFLCFENTQDALLFIFGNLFFVSYFYSIFCFPLQNLIVNSSQKLQPCQNKIEPK